MKDIEQEVKGSLGPTKLHKADVLVTMGRNDNLEQELSNLRFDMLRAGDELVTKLGDLENRIIMLERKLRFLVLPEIDDEYIGETD
jgi:hypothetical protein